MLGGWIFVLLEEHGLREWANLASSLFWAGLLAGRLLNSLVASRTAASVQGTLRQLAVNVVLSMVTPVVLVGATTAPVLVAFSCLSGLAFGGICERRTNCLCLRPCAMRRVACARRSAVHRAYVRSVRG